MGRRGENVFKRKDGRWEARYIKGRTSDGKAIYGYVYEKTYRDVKLKRKKAVEMLSEPVLKFPDKNYGELTDFWLNMVKPNLKESTYQTYKRHLNYHITPFLGSLRINTMTRLDIMNFITHCLKNGKLNGTGGLSPKTTTELLNIIKQTFKFAQSIGAHHGLELSIKIPKQSTTVEILTIKEQNRLLNYLGDNNIDIAILLAMFCGLRIGEICALGNCDIDLDLEIITISKTLYRIPIDNHYQKTKIVLTDTKTSFGKREIPIPKTIISIIRRHISKDIFFLNQNGKPYEPRTLSYGFKSVLRNAGIRDIPFHSLRHTFASRCIELGFDYNLLSEILGHSKASTTMNIYVHSNMYTKHKLMNQLSYDLSQ